MKLSAKNSFDGFDNGWQGPGSAALEALFCTASRVRTKAYERGWLKKHRLNAQVISVGNLVAGGAGKTPLVIALAQRLMAQGRRVAVLHRGYRAQAERGIYAIEPGMGTAADPALYGDEAVLMARRVPQIWVLSGADRVALGLRAIDYYACDTLILDDGFQHQRLHRDLNVVVLRAPHFLGNGFCLPRGPLREPVEALARSSLIVFNNSAVSANTAAQEQDFPSELFDFIKQLKIPTAHFSAQVTKILQVNNQHKELVHFSSSAFLWGQRLVLACAVARPEAVVRTVESLGGIVVGTFIKRDHGAWSAEELQVIHRRAQNLAAHIITTEKDAVKWKNPPWAYLILRQEIRWTQGEAILDKLLDG